MIQKTTGTFALFGIDRGWKISADIIKVFNTEQEIMDCVNEIHSSSGETNLQHWHNHKLLLFKSINSPIKWPIHAKVIGSTNLDFGALAGEVQRISLPTEIEILPC